VTTRGDGGTEVGRLYIIFKSLGLPNSGMDRKSIIKRPTSGGFEIFLFVLQFLIKFNKPAALHGDEHKMLNLCGDTAAKRLSDFPCFYWVAAFSRRFFIFMQPMTTS
jgi:hypothetical protein